MDSWAIVEIMGHRKLVGRAREVVWLGATFLEVEPLNMDGAFGGAERYTAAALFSYRKVTEEQARRALVPRFGWSCDNFEDSVVLPGSCRNCGNAEGSHAATHTKALPAHEDPPSESRGCCGEFETGSGQHGPECGKAPESIPW